MSRKRRELIESPSGHGTVVQKGNVLCGVRYQLRIYQEYLILEHHDGTDEVAGQRSITGTAWPDDGTYLFGEENLVLNLADGRTMPFFVSRGNPPSGFEVVPSGSLG